MIAHKFTTEDADRLLGLADQFLHDWRDEFDSGDSDDERIIVREQEWKEIRPLLLAAPRLFVALDNAFEILDRIADTLHYQDGHPVTALDARDIATIFDDARAELALIETLLRQATGEISPTKKD